MYILSYFRKHWRGPVLFLLCAAICGAVFYLYGLPAESVLYAAALCLVPCLGFLIVDIVSYSRRVRALRELLRNIRVSIERLPEPRDGVEGAYDALLRELEAGNVPLRVTHNDTKMDNVLLDEKTGRGVCIIDLDTVMPGLSAWDFGDAVRTGANTAGEDERDLSRVAFSLPMFKAYVSGYLRGLGGELTRRELDLLPLGAKLMTLECGMRFLADHLNGDRYFHIRREGHNLDRARTQFRLVECMEKNWDAMVEIVKNA